jgi:sugar diacid utilization regulator/GAF domain-containing protein
MGGGDRPQQPGGRRVAAGRSSIRERRLEAAALDALAEVDGLRSVAGRILRSRELDEALVAVTNETLRLLNADIAGVMLRDGEEIFMRSCAGNQMAETAHLRMRRGQGLAGLVFATGRAEKVDDYLSSAVISDDFRNLARLERTRSAAAAPLVVDRDVIGVLEVWRRRSDGFTAAEINRLIALADLAAIALDNARLHAASEASARAVEDAHRTTGEQLARVERALELQQDLIAALLDGTTVAGISRIVGERCGLEVSVVGADMEQLASWPEALDPGELMMALDEVRRATPGSTATHWRSLSAGLTVLVPVRAAQMELGWVCVTGSEVTRDEVELAAHQTAMAVALKHLEEQAAVKARASMRDEILIHLLRGGPGERRAAVARARYLQVDLRGPLRVALCRLAGPRSSPGWSEAYEDRVRRRLVSLCESRLAESGLLKLVAMAGEDVVALIQSTATARLHQLLASVLEELWQILPGANARWGVSSEHSGATDLDSALDEAMVAIQALGLDAARKVALYEDLGILGLLIAGPRGGSLTEFARSTLGAVMTHDSQNGTSLLDTLRTYLDSNCNQRDTAAKLLVHQKTVKYRLELIERLSGLSLDEHRDRMRADVAVRALDLGWSAGRLIGRENGSRRQC